MNTSEQKVLVLAANPDPDKDKLAEIRSTLATIADIDYLIELAIREGMTGFLYKSLINSGLMDMLPPENQQRLFTNYYLTVRKNLKLIHALNEIVTAVDQRRLQVILMQGISMLHQVYQDIGLRPMNDMDIWVLPDQYDDLVDCLDQLGYEKNRIYPNTFRNGDVMLDIQTHILGGDRIKNRDLLIDLDQKEIFRDARLITNANTSALCLSPSDQFLYLSLHALKHNLERLIWLADIYSIVISWDLSDWRALILRAEQLGQQATLGYMHFVLTNIFKLKLPSELLSTLDACKPKMFERMVLDRRINGRPISTWSQLLLISSGKGLHKRISFIKEPCFRKQKY